MDPPNSKSDAASQNARALQSTLSAGIVKYAQYQVKDKGRLPIVYNFDQRKVCIVTLNSEMNEGGGKQKH